MVALVVLATVAAGAAIGIASASRFAPSLDSQIEGLTALLGGWRQAGWPSGIQEDDAEARWADRHGRPPPGRAGQEPSSEPRACLPDDPEGPFSSWIEELD